MNDSSEELTAYRHTNKENRSESTRCLTFTMFAISFVARLADAFIRANGVLADCIDAAVVQHFCTLVHVWKRKKDKVD